MGGGRRVDGGASLLRASNARNSLAEHPRWGTALLGLNLTAAELPRRTVPCAWSGGGDGCEGGSGGVRVGSVSSISMLIRSPRRREEEVHCLPAGKRMSNSTVEHNECATSGRMRTPGLRSVVRGLQAIAPLLV